MKTLSRACRGLAILVLAAGVAFTGCMAPPNRPPVLVFTVEPRSGQAPLLLRMEAASSHDPDGDAITSYIWEIDGGAIGWAPAAEHVIAAQGEHRVRIMVTDEHGECSSAEAAVVVFGPPAGLVSAPVGGDQHVALETERGMRIEATGVSSTGAVLKVSEFSAPPQPDEDAGSLVYACDIELSEEIAAATGGEPRGSLGLQNAVLSFDIPDIPELRALLILRFGDDGWELCPDAKGGPLGGGFSPDASQISVSIEHFSAYGLYAYDLADMQAVISAAPSGSVLSAAETEKIEGGITIPAGTVEGFAGGTLPIRTPLVFMRTNANIEADGWKTIGQKTVVWNDWDWDKAYAGLLGATPARPPSERDDAQRWALYSALSMLIHSVDAGTTTTELRILVQEKTTGERCAVIQVADPEKTTWLRANAGQLELYGGCFGGYTLDKALVWAIAEKLELPDDHTYWLSIESDAEHATDKYVGYLSVSESGSIVMTPRLYAGDKAEISHFDWRGFSFAVDHELPMSAAMVLDAGAVDQVTLALGASGMYMHSEAPSPVVFPTVETRPATGVAQTSATVSGAVTSDGGAGITERRLDWGTTSSCSDGSTNQVTVSGSTFSFQVTGLIPNTKYYFRAWAKNSSGWGQGIVLSFTTSSPTVTGAIQGWTVTPNPATAGQSSVGLSVVVKNTGTGTYTFPVGLSVWKVGSSIDTALINEWRSVTLAAGAQQTVTFTPHTFSSSEAGSWCYQFGQWTSDRATSLDKKPSPAEILTVNSAPLILTFTSLTPSTITTSSPTYQATLQATGSNFSNVNRVTYSWSGPDNGSITWYQGDANWNSAVTVYSDGSMTLRPTVLSNETSSQSKTWTWTVTLRDNTGATAYRSFTVTHNP